MVDLRAAKVGNDDRLARSVDGKTKADSLGVIAGQQQCSCQRDRIPRAGVEQLKPGLNAGTAGGWMHEDEVA
mgnify:CR=1 FL=1